MEFQLDLLKQKKDEILVDRAPRPIFKSATFREQDFKQLITEDLKTSKTDIKIATARTSGNYEPVWEYKNTLRQTDFAQELIKQRQINKNRY
jgi:hypothetical protein